MATSPLAPRASRRGRSFYVTPGFSGVLTTKRRETIRIAYLTRAFWGAQTMAELLCNPCILGAPQHQARVDNEKWPPQPRLLGAQNIAELLRNPCILGAP